LPSLRIALALAIVAVLCSLISLSARQAAAPAPRKAPIATPWGSWVEPDFPFFSSVLDAGNARPDFPKPNLTPRGLILKAGGGNWVGFDTDLLRVAAIWQGESVTPKALAPGSYHQPDRKTPGGQSPAPEPDGTVVLANGIYPGWQTGTRPSFEDPREPAPSPEEVGRGPLSETAGRFKAIRLVRAGTVLEYTAGGADVREWITVSGSSSRPVLERHIDVAASTEPLWLVLGFTTPETSLAVASSPAGSAVLEQLPFTPQTAGTKGSDHMVHAVRVAPHTSRIAFCVSLTKEGAAPTIQPRAIPTEVAPVRWPQQVTTHIKQSTAHDAYVVDEVALPDHNPWRRYVRPGDVQFLSDGTAATVTLEGDVWLIRGMHEPRGTARWRRFASGLHEPLTLAIRDDEIYVFDRNGIWRLRDTNKDGEADVHELFSNAFGQTADMREFPNTIRLAPHGEFVIAKGNQQSVTLGKHNGTVLRISADGRTSTVLGYGFRQPNIGVNVRTGLVTASDQQGNYIPSTPLHIVRDHQFYGFLSAFQPREVYPAPIAEALTWIPHPANASALSQVWLFNAKMGPLNDALVHIGFNRPELFRVLLNNRGSRPQAAVVSITSAFEYPPMNGSVNPADGFLYIAGLQILGWGTTAKPLAGLGRVRYTGRESTVPSDLVPTDQGLLLRFDTALEAEKATDPDSYSVTSWHYQRTYKYGSPQLNAAGKPGIDRLAPSAAYVSKDGRAVFIAVPDIKPVMQMRLAWSLSTAKGINFQNSAYFTPYELTKFDPQAEGFGDLKVNLTPRAITAGRSAPVSAAEGQRLYQLYGCMACHSTEGAAVQKLGPTFKGLYGSDRTFAAGVVRVTADEAYIRESILEPSAKIVSGYEKGEAGMPSYAGVLTDSQVESVILFIKSLK
jgi:glucose/arabinose dehydrogenase/mono/diheme cytochrome c family protein